MQTENKGADGLPFSVQETSSARATVRYLLIVFVLAAVLTFVLLYVLTDVLALHTTLVTAEVSVTTETDTRAFADALGAAGVIRTPWFFLLDTRLRDGDFAAVSGTYTLTNRMDYRALRRAVQYPVRKRREISVTIPPGTTIPQLIAIFTKAGVGTPETWARAINETDYAFAFLDGLPREGRLWRLEGYLFPDTYRVWQDSTPETVVYRMLSNFEKKFDARYLARAAALGYSVDEVVTMASLLQAESRYPDEYARIAAVFYNRLNSRNYPYLESDATVQYALPAHKATLSREDLATDSPYNTYTHRGLPPSAICAPGADALLYALFPAKTNEYFFVSGGGRAYFAATYAAHKQNIARAAREAAQRETAF